MDGESLSSYVPEDGRITLSALEFLHSAPGAQLRERVAALLVKRAATTVADVASFRADFPADIVHAAFALMQFQPKAVGLAGKFSSLPFLWAVPEALEQATDAAVARHKAARFAAAGVTQIVDLCAGVGGDTMALANIAPVTAIDLSPVRTLCLRWNLDAAAPRFPVDIRTQDLRAALPALTPAAAFHIDPSRRSEGKRSPRYEDLIPGPPVLAEVMTHFPGGAIKLSSAVDFDSLPPGHLELISHRGTVVQAVLWTGTLAALFPPDTRTASIIQANQPAFTFTAVPDRVPLPPPTDAPPSFLYEVDGALTRASLAAPLAASLQLVALTSDGGYLAGDILLIHAALTVFTILKIVPYSEHRVADALRQVAGDPGPVEVKTRGGLPGIDTDRLQRLWTKAANVRRTVLLYRHHDDILAAIAARA